MKEAAKTGAAMPAACMSNELARCCTAASACRSPRSELLSYWTTPMQVTSGLFRSAARVTAEGSKDADLRGLGSLHFASSALLLLPSSVPGVVDQHTQCTQG